MKRTFILLLICILTLLAACGKETEAPSEEVWSPVVTPTVAETTLPMEEPTTLPAVIPEAEIVQHETEPAWDVSTPQKGEPISPQPGDTSDTWNPSLISQFPLDGDCGDLELLEKWMTVEGLTMEDLEQRNCEQLVLAVARGTDGVETFTLCYEKQEDGSWESVSGLTWMRGWMGSKGIMHGRKINSLTSPAGLWALDQAFGNEAKPDGIKMPWRDVTPNTDWVCDVESPYFNTWQERDNPNLEGTWSDDVEHLENYRNAYAYACVIRYNTAPYCIPDRGCAIFFHCSSKPTEGCVGLPREDMLRALLWLDPEKNPYILITGYQFG